jgi:hypothetical protein
VLDGVIRYGDDTAIVLESKIKLGPVDSSQAVNINLGGQPVQFDGYVRNISWRECFSFLHRSG